ncbi:MAG: hypothetical protein B6244_03480 [Candidatus Cloacimonetes bacterium 4572_55]|nr:MAG: hypothetical protein B6244_03480 [Candidatus Cloacimonetes bacterium 4572_55]
MSISMDDRIRRDKELFEEATKEFGSEWRLRWSRIQKKLKKYSFDFTVVSSKFIKRIFDIIGGAILILLLSPVYLITMIAIKIEDPSGPIFFHQERKGLYGESFRMYKFRSMYKDADKRKAELSDMNEMEGGVIFKIKDDPRITKVGKFIRKYSIDELPQFYNVLIGDMTLVGPRPPVPGEVALYSRKDKDRLKVKPGITCIWQVSGRSNIPFEEQVDLDKQYILSQSVWLDIKLLFKTVGAVFKSEGAY